MPEIHDTSIAKLKTVEETCIRIMSISFDKLCEEAKEVDENRAIPIHGCERSREESTYIIALRQVAS